MLREEAIKIIKECKEKGFKHTFYTVNEFDTALDMAIKALRHEDTFIDKALEIIEGEASDPDYEKDNDGCMYSEGWIECGFTIAEMIRALKGGEQE